VKKPNSPSGSVYGHTGWDADLRAFCREKNIAYQSFWTLTANPDLLAGPCATVAQELQATPEQVLPACLLAQRDSPVCLTRLPRLRRGTWASIRLSCFFGVDCVWAHRRFSFGSFRCGA
jgi:hypothetical protein